jgi:hypothetical protein
VTLRAVDSMAMASRAAVSRIAPEGWMVIFATLKTEGLLAQAVPGILWKKKLATAGLEEGLMLFGQLEG